MPFTYSKTFIIKLVVCYVLLALIGGSLFWYFYSKENVVAQNEQAQNSSEIADWKTYKNNEYAFEFQYPQNEDVSLIDHISPHGTDLVFPNNNFVEKDGSVGSILTFSVFQKATDNLEKYISDDLSRSNAVNVKFNLAQSSYQKININGVVAYKITYPSSTFRLCTQNSEHTFCFQYSGSNNTGAQQIISTFKFTDSTETVDWKTYRNDEYGFEFQYPVNWKFTDNSKIIEINNTKNIGVQVESPLRNDLIGYQGIPVSYRILIYNDSSGVIRSVAQFGSPDSQFLQHQSWWNIDVDEKIKNSTIDYSIGQQIISSFRLTK